MWFSCAGTFDVTCRQVGRVRVLSGYKSADFKRIARHAVKSKLVSQRSHFDFEIRCVRAQEPGQLLLQNEGGRFSLLIE